MKYFATIFIICYSFVLLRPIAPVFDYFINQDYITSVLCINKNKPQLQCNGQCHMAKELKRAQSENDKGQPTSVEEFYSFCFSPFQNKVSVYQSVANLFIATQQQKAIKVPNLVWRPPTI